MDELTVKRIEQLRNYAKWERENFPNGRVHILDWASDEIERLNKKIETLQDAQNSS